VDKKPHTELEPALLVKKTFCGTQHSRGGGVRPYAVRKGPVSYTHTFVMLSRMGGMEKLKSIKQTQNATFAKMIMPVHATYCIMQCKLN